MPISGPSASSSSGPPFSAKRPPTNSTRGRGRGRLGAGRKASRSIPGWWSITRARGARRSASRQHHFENARTAEADSSARFSSARLGADDRLRVGAHIAPDPHLVPLPDGRVERQQGRDPAHVGVREERDRVAVDVQHVERPAAGELAVDHAARADALRQVPADRVQVEVGGLEVGDAAHRRARERPGRRQRREARVDVVGGELVAQDALRPRVAHDARTERAFTDEKCTQRRLHAQRGRVSAARRSESPGCPSCPAVLAAARRDRRRPRPRPGGGAHRDLGRDPVQAGGRAPAPLPARHAGRAGLARGGLDAARHRRAARGHRRRQGLPGGRDRLDRLPGGGAHRAGRAGARAGHVDEDVPPLRPGERP